MAKKVILIPNQTKFQHTYDLFSSEENKKMFRLNDKRHKELLKRNPKLKK